MPLICGGIQQFSVRGNMKPAIETPSGVSNDPYSKTVCCLRCEQKLQRYRLIRVTLAPGIAGHAILSCPRCGHVEFVSDSSPLLPNLELVSADMGDGD
jgi:RNase P subunit RPR2